MYCSFTWRWHTRTFKWTRCDWTRCQGSNDFSIQDTNNVVPVIKTAVFIHYRYLHFTTLHWKREAKELLIRLVPYRDQLRSNCLAMYGTLINFGRNLVTQQMWSPLSRCSLPNLVESSNLYISKKTSFKSLRIYSSHCLPTYLPNVRHSRKITKLRMIK